MSSDQERVRLCKTLLKPADAPGSSGWLRFTQDPTATRKAWNSGGPVCEPDAVWLPEYHTERGRAHPTKFTAAGDFVYRLSFEIPTEPPGSPGHILPPTFKPEHGYLYFEWWNTTQMGSGLERYVQRSMKVRIREPSRLRADPPT